MRLTDLLDLRELERAIEDGYVRAQTHPSEPLAILNYMHRCQYDRAWTPVTRQCRGLIYRTDTLEVVARPWPKFFNYGEYLTDGVDLTGTLDLDAPVTVTDKLDGSLGILYPLRDGTHAVATRGSFTSEQALHATEVYRERYEGRWAERCHEFTYLFEIVYRANRVVVDYGGSDDLYLLGVVDTVGGWTLSYPGSGSWPGRRAATFSANTLREALALPPRPNAEGVVVRFEDTGLMVKLKQEDYVRLHRLVTGLTERTVWAHLAAGLPLADLLEPLPEEFHGWVREVAESLLFQHRTLMQWARDAYDLIFQSVQLHPDGFTRKEFAVRARAQSAVVSSYLFLLLDGKHVRLDQVVWRDLKPPADRAPRTWTEDTA